jgi:hypothetical protein
MHRFRSSGDWVPIAVFLAVGAVVAAAAWAAGQNPLDARTWAHWDSIQYEAIARHGYRIDPCTPFPRVPGALCGNAGWFPGYPLLMAALLGLGVPMPAGGVAVSWLFSLATLILLWRTFLGRRLDSGSVACLVFVACPPGAVFHYAQFPLSMNEFFMVLALWHLHRHRWLAAGLVGAVVSASYVIGVFLAPVAAIWAGCQGRGTRPAERARRAALSGGVMSLGGVAVVTAMKLSTGHWDAYFRTQANFYHHLTWPGYTFSDRLQPLLWGSGLERVPAVQMLAVAAVMLLLLVRVARGAGFMDPTRWLVLGLCLVLWLWPLSQSNAPLWRSAGVLVPAGLLLRDLPARVAIPLVAAFVALAVPMTMFFVENRLT